MFWLFFSQFSFAVSHTEQPVELLSLPTSLFKFFSGTHYVTKPAESTAPPSISSASHLFTFVTQSKENPRCALLCFAFHCSREAAKLWWKDSFFSFFSHPSHQFFPSWVSFEEEEENPTMALVHTTRSVVVRSLLRGRSPSQQPQWCRLFSGNNQEEFVLFRLHCEFCHEA